MSRYTGTPSRFESQLASLLLYGTGMAMAVIGVGIALALRHWSSALPIITVGIALLIALPIGRVLMMLIAFSRARDYRFVAITATVLVVILAGFALGIHTSISTR